MFTIFYMTFLIIWEVLASDGTCESESVCEDKGASIEHMNAALPNHPDATTYPTRPLTVDTRETLSLEEYFDLYDGKWPVLINDVVPTWPAYNLWSQQYICSNYASSHVTVRMTSGDPPVSEGSRVRLSKFCDFINQNTNGVHKGTGGQGDSDHWWYIEDETFLETHPQIKQHINIPVYLREDYFSLLPEAVRPWSQMFLWGSPQSRSPLHLDPYNWTAASALISGRKEWKLFPPGQDSALHVIPDARCGFPLDCIKYNSALDMFSNKTESTHTSHIYITQHPGQLLIIPTGWFHQAYNPILSLSVSMEVMNTGNVKQVLGEMVKAGNFQSNTTATDFDKLLHTENFDHLTPTELKLWMEKVFSQIPEDIIQRGAEVKRKMLEDD